MLQPYLAKPANEMIVCPKLCIHMTLHTVSAKFLSMVYTCKPGTSIGTPYLEIVLTVAAPNSTGLSDGRIREPDLMYFIQLPRGHCACM